MELWVEELRRLKSLADESIWFKALVTDLSLEKPILRDVLSK